MTQVKGRREMIKLTQHPAVDVAVIGGGTWGTWKDRFMTYQPNNAHKCATQTKKETR